MATTLRPKYQHADGTTFCFEVYTEYGFVGQVQKFNGDSDWTSLPAFGTKNPQTLRGFTTPEEAARAL